MGSDWHAHAPCHRCTKKGVHYVLDPCKGHLTAGIDMNDIMQVKHLPSAFRACETFVINIGSRSLQWTGPLEGLVALISSVGLARQVLAMARHDQASLFKPGCFQAGSECHVCHDLMRLLFHPEPSWAACKPRVFPCGVNVQPGFTR